MLKKMLWMVMLVLITACAIYISNGGIVLADTTPSAVPATSEVTMLPIDPTATLDATADETGGLVCPGETTATPVDTATEVPTATTAATETPSATQTLAPTTAVTAQPTSTPTTAPTATTVPPTATPTTSATVAATATPTTSGFALQTGSPVYMANFTNTSAGCKWSGVAGQVFDVAGNPLNSYIVKITGTYNGTAVNKVGVTGMVSGTPYGQGSYEIVLGTTAINSTGLLSITVFDSSGNQVSNPVKFDTFSDCSKNLVIMNFKHN